MNEPKHTLAALRRAIGLNQKEMADLLGCALPTIQAIEYGKLKLSEKLGLTTMARTGVDLEWLLKNDVAQPIVAYGGKPYTRDQFDRVRAGALSGERIDTDYRRAAFLYLLLSARMARTIIAAYRKNDLNLALYRLNFAMHEIGEGFPGGHELEVAWLDYIKTASDEKKPFLDIMKFVGYGFLRELSAAREKKGQGVKPKK